VRFPPRLQGLSVLAPDSSGVAVSAAGNGK
jgi:hypothetical protein